MKVDLHDSHHLSALWHKTERFCLLPFHVLLKFHSAFISRPPRSSLDVHQRSWQTHALLSHHPSTQSDCPASQEKKKKKNLSAAKALSSPSLSIVHTATNTSIHLYAWTHTHTHTHTFVLRNMSAEPVKIWSRPTWTRCLNLLVLMFSVDLYW